MAARRRDRGGRGIGTRLARRAEDTAQIKAPAMNITLGSIGFLSLAAALTTWQNAFEFLFGKDASDNVRAAVLIATIAAVVIVAAADMLSRALAARGENRYIAPWAKGWTARLITGGEDEPGFVVAGMRVSASNPDKIEYLVVKDGESKWRPASKVTLVPPTAT